MWWLLEFDAPGETCFVRNMMLYYTVQHLDFGTNGANYGKYTSLVLKLRITSWYNTERNFPRRDMNLRNVEPNALLFQLHITFTDQRKSDSLRITEV
jgi:hypothetical protein